MMPAPMIQARREPIDAGTVLVRGLVANAAAAGCTATVDSHRSLAWSSATFVGEQHVLALRLTGDAAAWLAALPETDFTLRRHLVADIRVVNVQGAMATIEVLTLEAA